MYNDFYGLKEKPFNLTPDPKFLYLSSGHREALEHLAYGITNKEGFILITGDIGTGKTTLCRAFLERLDQNPKTAIIFNSFLTEDELLESILQDFGFASTGGSRKEQIDLLNKNLIHLLSLGGNGVLIIDEAQNLSIPVLEQIRMLSNLETEKEKLLQIVLIGQAELREKLGLPHLKQLKQRISVRYHLKPFGKNEIPKYIHHRLMVSGSQGRITFSWSALGKVFKYSRGIPRMINLICDRALLNGFVKGKFKINSSMVLQAVKSLDGEEKFHFSRSKFNLAVFLGSILFPLLGIAFFAFTTLQDQLGGYLKSLFPASSTPKPSPETIHPPAKWEAYKFDASFPYVVLVGALPTEKLALEMIQKLESFPEPKYISKTYIPEKGVGYRVLMGRFNTQARAHDLLVDLEKRGFRDAKVMEAVPEGK